MWSGDRGGAVRGREEGEKHQTSSQRSRMYCCDWRLWRCRASRGQQTREQGRIARVMPPASIHRTPPPIRDTYAHKNMTSSFRQKCLPSFNKDSCILIPHIATHQWCSLLMIILFIVWTGPWCLLFFFLRGQMRDFWPLCYPRWFARFSDSQTGWDAFVSYFCFFAWTPFVLFSIATIIMCYLVCSAIPFHHLILFLLNRSWKQFTFSYMFLWMQSFCILKMFMLSAFMIWDYNIQWRQRFEKIKGLCLLFLPRRTYFCQPECYG